MKIRTAIKIVKPDSDYWWQQNDDYNVRGVKNNAYIASRRIIRHLNNAIKKAKK